MSQNHQARPTATAWCGRLSGTSLWSGGILARDESYRNNYDRGAQRLLEVHNGRLYLGREFCFRFRLNLDDFHSHNGDLVLAKKSSLAQLAPLLLAGDTCSAMHHHDRISTWTAGKTLRLLILLTTLIVEIVVGKKEDWQPWNRRQVCDVSAEQQKRSGEV